MPSRLPPDLVRGIDRLVKSGRYANRSEVVKEATRLLLSSGDLPPPSSLAKVAARVVSLIVAWNTPTVESVVLYGSVARGEATSQSDIDILIIVSQGKPWQIRKTLYELIYPVIAGLGLDISLTVFSRDSWLGMLRQGDPFATSVLKEGLLLWGQLAPPA